jgi:hypothetical protein
MGGLVALLGANKTPAGMTFDNSNSKAPVLEGCSALTRLVFLGDAPDWIGVAFGQDAPDVTVFYLGGSIGFTAPTWNGYPSVMIDESAYPAASWLLQNDLPYDLNLREDSEMLVAYAFDAEPGRGLPEPVADPVTGSVNLTFHGASPGIVYSVETSPDLQRWTTEGVTLSEVGPDKQVTASMTPQGTNAFLRLVVAIE